MSDGVFQDIKSSISGTAFSLCMDCGNVADWEGRGDFTWVECQSCGSKSGEHLDPPNAKLEWNRANA